MIINTVNAETLKGFDQFEALYQDKSNGLRWPYVFSLPGWASAWWKHFGADYELLILTLRQKEQLVGIAPLKKQGRTASFIGDASVCDYLDFIVAPGKETVFAEMLPGECAARGIATLELATLRPDSVAAKYVLPIARGHGFMADCRESDISYEMALPDSYEEYLANLDAKQRRELLRKQRNLEMEAQADLRVLQGRGVSDRDMDPFFSFMSESRSDKAGFLTETMKGFFKDMMRAMSSYGFLRLGFLGLGVKEVASVLCFDYNNVMYLYNSGYDPAFAGQSVGLLSKLACIRRAIEQKSRVFDFLKGAEVYKARLGGQRVSLSSCRISLG